MMAEVILNGVAFPLRPDPPKHGRIMQLMRVEKRGTDGDKATAFLDFLEAMLADDVDHVAFEDAICEMDSDEIAEALKQAAESYKVDPTSAGQESSSRSGGGSPTGTPMSKVVNFSKGTVEVQRTPPESSTA